jgi:hypothetical protein
MPIRYLSMERSVFNGSGVAGPTAVMMQGVLAAHTRMPLADASQQASTKNSVFPFCNNGLLRTITRLCKDSLLAPSPG